MMSGTRMIWSPLPNHPRWSTVLLGLLILALVGWRTRRPTLACVALVAWLSLYEVIWQGCDVLPRHRDLTAYGWLVLALAAWPLLAYQLGVRPHPVGLAVCAAGFAAWLALGFQYNWFGEARPVAIVPEALNVLTKMALGVAYLAGAPAAPAAARRARPAPGGQPSAQTR
jgi:hypothetical protein